MKYKTFSILSNKVRIQYKKKLLDYENKPLLGRVDFNKNIIEICTHTQDGELIPDDILFTTLTHELSHLMLFMLGQNELNDNETFVDLLGQMLAQFHKTLK